MNIIGVSWIPLANAWIFISDFMELQTITAVYEKYAE